MRSDQREQRSPLGQLFDFWHRGFSNMMNDLEDLLDGNDLVDFHHVMGAVVYCDAFLTERPLHTFITTNPVALDREFNCKVISDGLEALKYVLAL